MEKRHYYHIITNWTGNRGNGTSGYREYGREHIISSPNKIDIHCSSDPGFRGDKTKYNPEELLLSSLSGCHMLWYLHLCTEAGIVVTAYADHAAAVLEEKGNGSGKFVEATLKPQVTVADPSMVNAAEALHAEVAKYCFIARSVNFPVRHEATVRVG